MSSGGELRREVAIAEVAALSPTVRKLVLQTVDHELLHWRPGQHVELVLDHIEPQRQRPFSIASAPDPARPGRLEIAVARDDSSATATALLALDAGARLQMKGPKGSFTGEQALGGSALLVATGTGVAPLRAMLQAELAARPTGAPLALLFGCRTAQDVLWGDELHALEQRSARFRFEPTLSQPPAGWTGRVGYVQQHIDELLGSLGAAPVLLCGNPAMVAEVQAVLERLRHPPELVFTEQQG